MNKMTQNELRIGNYVYYEHTTHVVSGVHGNSVYSWWVKDGKPVIEYEAKDSSGTQVENPYMDVVRRYEPIPLTEEWLEKLGLIKRNQTEELPGELQQPDIDEDGDIWYTWVKGVFNLEIQSNGEIWFELYSHYKHIKWVHELQNLYFALTEEELTLQEK
jgi:hypothetical protein